MKTITDLNVLQDRLYATDIIPFRFINTDSCLTAIKQAFNFKEVESLTDKVNFSKGEFKLNNKIKVLDILSIEPKRIWFNLYGTSKEANSFYTSLRKIIISFDQNELFRRSKALMKIEQTICNATLDVDFKNIFAKKLLDYLNWSVLEKFSSDSAKAYIRGMRLSTEIFYEPKDPNVISHNVSLYPVYFTIEPRVDTPIEERRFHTVSPTDSDTHFKLIEEFEKLFKDKLQEA
jgi:hypothetical protein